MSSQQELNLPISDKLTPISPDYFKRHPSVVSKISELRICQQGYTAFEIVLECGTIVTLPPFRQHEFTQLAKGDDVTLSPFKSGSEILAANFSSVRGKKESVRLTLGLDHIFDPSDHKPKK